MSQPAQNNNMQKKKESTRKDTLFLIIALREHAVSTFRPFNPCGDCTHFCLGRHPMTKTVKDFLVKFGDPKSFSHP